jgi:lysophospholipase L1-like esterase
MRQLSKAFSIALVAMLLPVAGAQNTAAPAPASAQVRMHWVGAWACATQVIYKTDTSNYTEFHDQTIRTFVHPSIGGKTVRVKLSGMASYDAVPIGAASIGIRGSGNTIAAGTLHPLTFNSSKSIKIPAGSTIWSDPISFSFDASQDLVISLHVSEYTGGAETGHVRAITTNLVLAGDQTNTGSVPSSPSPKKISTNFFVQGVDVLADEHSYALVALGDSITDGMKSSWDANHRWPDYLSQRLAAAHGVTTSATISVLNAGISGNRLLHDFGGPDVFSRLGRDVLEQPGARFVILLEGINDINMNANNPKGLANQVTSAEEMIWAYQQLANQLHAAGFKMIVGTLTPEKGIEPYLPQMEKDRTTVNRWIRSSKVFDGVIDFDAAVRDPSDPARLLPAYDSGDHIHLSDAGYKAMADAIDVRAFISTYLPSELLHGKAAK